MMARWAIHWESTPDDGRPRWLHVLRGVAVLVVLVVLVAAVAGAVVLGLVKALG